MLITLSDDLRGSGRGLLGGLSGRRCSEHIPRSRLPVSLILAVSMTAAGVVYPACPAGSGRAGRSTSRPPASTDHAQNAPITPPWADAARRDRSA